MYTLEGIDLIISSWNYVRMLIIIMSWTDLKLVHVGSKTRSLGQILGKPCVASRGHSFYSKVMRLCQNVNIISRSDLKLGHGGSKTRSLGQILEKHCVHSRENSFNPKFMKLCQIVNHYHI